MNITFTFLESLRSQTSPDSLSKMQLWGRKHHTKGVDQQKLRRADIFSGQLSIATSTNPSVVNTIQICINRIIYQVTGLNIKTGHQKFSELRPKKAAL